MKISKTLLGAVIASTLIFGSAATTGAIAATETPAPVATEIPISKHVHKHDKKVILEARKSAKELEKSAAKLAKQATMAAYQDALAAWRLANADALNAIKEINKTFKETLAPVAKAKDGAEAALNKAAKKLDKANKSGDAAVIANAQSAYDAATKLLETAMDLEKKVLPAAIQARKDAFAALGALPEKPAKPVIGNGGKNAPKKGKKD